MIASASCFQHGQDGPVHGSSAMSGTSAEPPQAHAMGDSQLFFKASSYGLNFAALPHPPPPTHMLKS